MIRQPIVAVLGHVDHGKTSLLDRIRGTAVAKTEAGGITQHVGASEIPAAVIKNICGPLLERMGVGLEIPGLLLLDTPGHEAFTTIRKRGGSIADIAILVVDMHESLQQQSFESIEILKHYKTPFIVAATKLDRITGWKRSENRPFVENVENQPSMAIEELEEKIYKIVGKLSEHGFQSERFDRITDFSKQVAIVPVSSITGEGVADLLMTVAGLAQHFLKERLEVSEKNGEGTILEVKEIRGLGTTIDVILYNGTISKNDFIVIGGKEPVETKIKALLKPPALKQMGLEKNFLQVDSVNAAAGIKIAAPGLEKVVAGNPLLATQNKDEIESLKAVVQKDVQSVEIFTEEEGLIVKADTLGSLEALIKILKGAGIPIRKAEVGPVAKQDVMEIEQSIPEHRAIMVFNNEILPDAEEYARTQNVKIISSNIIYRLIEEYQKWSEDVRKKSAEDRLSKVSRPCEMRVLPGFIFRDSKPAVFGVEILSGVLKTGYSMKQKKDGKIAGVVKELQDQGQNMQSAEKGRRVAVSMDEPTVGRQVNEGDVLVTVLNENDLKTLRDLYAHLRDDEKILLSNYA
ncbi:MAG: translation initiation factor IF-2 [Candidatus Aenigmarchaeota archaeon]|nr:translation initiation factor IF-2 [Candidatus Aenigmarchaeota archaeon]